MLTQQRTTKAAKITRAISVGMRFEGFTPEVFGIVTETTHQKPQDKTVTTIYDLTRIPTDFGAGFEVRKEYAPAGEGCHHVHLDRLLGDSCTCADHIYRSVKCKHLEMVAEALRRGLL
jgi:hypothetical protein